MSKQTWKFETGTQIQAYTLCGLVSLVYVVRFADVTRRASLDKFTTDAPAFCQPQVGEQWTYRTEHTNQNVAHSPEHPTTIDRNTYECAVSEPTPADLSALENVTEDVLAVQCDVTNDRNDWSTQTRLLFLTKQRVYAPLTRVLPAARKVVYDLCPTGQIAEPGLCVKG